MDYQERRIHAKAGLAKNEGNRDSVISKPLLPESTPLACVIGETALRRHTQSNQNCNIIGIV